MTMADEAERTDATGVAAGDAAGAMAMPDPGTPAPAADPFDGLPPIFRECVDPEPDRRYVLSRPWRAGPFVYATDGRIAVRMAAGPDCPVPGPAGRVPAKINDVFAGPFAAEPTPLPDVPDGRRPCRDCRGKGRLPARACTGCRGTGLCYRCECEAAHDCGRCGGAGKLEECKCLECGGRGYVVEIEPVRIANHYCISNEYIGILKRHGVSVVWLPARWDQAARFTAGEVEGVVMGMRPPDGV
jgi:hypothetical protein